MIRASRDAVSMSNIGRLMVEFRSSPSWIDSTEIGAVMDCDSDRFVCSTARLQSPTRCQYRGGEHLSTAQAFHTAEARNRAPTEAWRRRARSP